MAHSREWPSCGALLLAGMLAAACSDSTGPRGTPTPPTPPVEATLAFTMDSSIYVISTKEGATPSLLGPALVGGLAWSADSKRIAYFVIAPDDSVPGRWTIYVANPDGSGARPLVPVSQVECCLLSWRPSDPAASVVQ